MRVFLAILLYLVYPATVQLAPMDQRELKCAETREKIRKIESKMRQGYTAKQGVKMQDELRSLRELRKRICR